jgi:glucose-6-phosphate 1-dehydrogenase
MTERGWEIVMPILDAWRDSKEEIPKYEAGTWGPTEAHDLIERDGRQWRRP